MDGGTTSGYSLIGSVNSAIAPPIVMKAEMTAAKIGRSMKKWESFTGVPYGVERARPQLRRCAAAVGLFRASLLGAGSLVELVAELAVSAFVAGWVCGVLERGAFVAACVCVMLEWGAFGSPALVGEHRLRLCTVLPFAHRNSLRCDRRAGADALQAAHD